MKSIIIYVYKANEIFAKGKKSVEELDDEEYCELEYAIANAHQHM